MLSLSRLLAPFFTIDILLKMGMQQVNKTSNTKATAILLQASKRIQNTCKKKGPGIVKSGNRKKKKKEEKKKDSRPIIFRLVVRCPRGPWFVVLGVAGGAVWV